MGSVCQSGWAFARGDWVGPSAAMGRVSGLPGQAFVHGKVSSCIWCLGHAGLVFAGGLWPQEGMLLSVYTHWGDSTAVGSRGPHPHLAPRPAGAPEAPILVVGNKRDRQRLRFGPRRALAALVRRGWRCGYLECSAKYNWHVLRLFRELLRCALVRARPAHPALRLQGALHPARCSLM